MPIFRPHVMTAPPTCVWLLSSHEEEEPVHPDRQRQAVILLCDMHSEVLVESWHEAGIWIRARWMLSSSVGSLHI